MVLSSSEIAVLDLDQHLVCTYREATLASLQSAAADSSAIISGGGDVDSESSAQQPAARRFLQAELKSHSRSTSPEHGTVEAPKCQDTADQDGWSFSDSVSASSSAALPTNTLLLKDMSPMQQCQRPDSDTGSGTSSNRASDNVISQSDTLHDVVRWNPWRCCMNVFTSVDPYRKPKHGASETRFSTVMWLMSQGNAPLRESFTAIDRFTQAFAAKMARKKAGMRKKALLNAEAKA